MTHKKRFRLVLPLYDFLHSEQRYTEMARKGWLLKKRGSLLETYEKGSPDDLQYRMEFRSVDSWNHIAEMEEEELAVYRDCGWEPVCKSGGIFIFSAHGQAETAELYTDREGQLALLKRSRHYLNGLGFVWAAIFLLRCILEAVVNGRNLLGPGLLFGGDWLCLDLLVSLLFACWYLGYDAFRRCRLIRLVKKGVPLRSCDTGKHFWAGKILRRTFLVLLAVCSAGAIWMGAAAKTVPLLEPGSPAPYVLLGEVFEGSRAEEGLLGRAAENTVKEMEGLLSRQYHCQEEFNTADGKDHLWLDQDVYVLRFGSAGAAGLARHLLENTAFARYEEILREEVPGFDAVFSCRYAAAAVKGNRVACFTGAADTLNENWDQVLAVLLEKWETP